MSRVNPVAVADAPSLIREIYKQIESKMGKVPNMFLNMGNSKAILKGYMGLSEAVNETKWSPQVREQIALLVGEANGCQYCLSAHTVTGKLQHLNEDEIKQARKGQAKDKKTQAALTLAKAIVEKRGKATDQEVAALKEAGATDQEIAELVMIVVLNIFTNYFNLVTDTTLDFPKAPPLN